MTASPITRLDKLHILPALPNDCHLEIFSEITSTSEYAKEHPELSTPRIILAEQQTAGVGRFGASMDFSVWGQYLLHVDVGLLWIKIAVIDVEFACRTQSGKSP